ncbi:MAG: oligosaccharide flippase family protein [Chloroflexi bacterium]|nr:oligosaccharide flippase family protein [Chloroflexota bacterium]
MSSHSIKRNSIWLLLARITAQGLAILFTAIIARKLGVDDFGQFSFIASLLLVGNTFTNFGTDTFLVRETARANQVTDIAAQSFALQLLLSVLYCVAMLAYRSTPLFLYSLALFPLAIFSVNNALLRALNRMDLFWFLSLLNGSIQIFAAVFSVDVLPLCLFLLIGQFLLSTFSYLICRASLPTFRLFPLKKFSPILKLILPFAALTVLLVLIQRLGILSVSALLGDSATGLFSSITRVVDGLKLGHYAILGALLPALSLGSPDSWKSFRNAFVLLISVSLIFAVVLLVFARPIILILYGNEFTQASTPLALLGWSLLPYTISSFISYDLIARGLESVVVKSALVSLVIYIALYLWLIPTRGLIGAVWSALIGECLQGIVFVIFYKVTVTFKVTVT